VQFLQLRKLRDLEDYRLGRGHTGVGQGLHTHQIRSKSEKLFVHVRMDTPEFQSIRSSPGDDLKISEI